MAWRKNLPGKEVNLRVRKRKLLALVALVSLLSLLAGGNAALAVPGTYDSAADYKDNITPVGAFQATSDGDPLLEQGEGAKKSVIFTVTPEQPGKAAPDSNYTDGNANKTGQGTGVAEGYTTQDVRVRRAEGNKFLHGQFAKNTNACASCHMTHTAAGDALLVKNGIYNTCTSCHDGTLGKLNVFDMPNYNANVEVAMFEYVGGGSFGGAMDSNSNASMHLPTGYLELAAAPGGNRTKTDTVTTDTAAGANQQLKVNVGAWTADFTCSSCHQPHGSYSDRLLAPNPANIGRRLEKVAEWVFDNEPSSPTYQRFIAVPWADDNTYATWDSSLNMRVATNAGRNNRYTGPWVFGESYGTGMTQTVLFYQNTPPKTTVSGTVYGYLGFDQRPIVANVDLNKDRHTDAHGLYQLNELFVINYAKGIGVLKEGITLGGTANWGALEEERPSASVWSDSNRIKIAIVPALVVKVQKGVFKGDGDLVPTTGDYVVDTTVAGGNPYVPGLDGSITLWTGANKLNPNGSYEPAVKNGSDFRVYNSGTDSFSTVKYQQGITWFCAACHTDYYADIFVDYGDSYGSGNDGNKINGTLTATGLEGLYKLAYRHTINRGPITSEEGKQVFVYSTDYYGTSASQSLTCLSCHYAHGTSKEIMRNADDTKADTVDVNPSSTLKRYVNMAVCWKCHSIQHGDELMNSEGYWNSAIHNLER